MTGWTNVERPSIVPAIVPANGLRRETGVMMDRDQSGKDDNRAANGSDTHDHDESAGFSARTTARRLIRCAQTATLATLEPKTGAPFASLVTIATQASGAPILLLSDLAVHTRNIKADPRVSMLVDEGEAGNPLARARLSIVGRLEPVAEHDAGTVRRRFLAKHPDAAVYCDFADFGFYSLAMDRAHLVAGFGRIVDLAAAEILIDCSACGELLAAESGAVEHMNADHADAVALYATRLIGAPPGAWYITGLDPDGLDLRLDDATRRLPFPEKVRGVGGLRAVLKRLADQARSA